MRVAVTRTGGFAGLTLRAELETDDLPDGPRLRSLAEAALAAPAPDRPAVPGVPGVPDGFHYEISVDGRTVRAADPGLTEAQSALVRTVLARGR